MTSRLITRADSWDDRSSWQMCLSCKQNKDNCKNSQWLALYSSLG